MANSPQLDLPSQSTPSTPADGKELDLAIEEACRIIQFLADKYRELTSTTEQQLPRQNDAELKFLFIQWAGRMKDLLAVPANSRQDYIRRWLRDVAASASAKLAGKDTITILLDLIWDSIPLMELILAEKATPDTGPILPLIHQRYNQKKTQPAGERPDNQTARKKVLKEEEFLFRSEEVSEESIYVPHAGIVLVHPFLSTFFSRLQLWDKTGFTDLYARQKAVYLLHYLATGERRGPEYDMVLPKLLCGYALEMALPGDILLGDEACAEGDLLLRNVLERWEKLKNSSIDALREGFLRRDGKLYTHNDRLCLQVEAGAIDILLDFLPWNISLVKLPWLKDILYVEWR